MSVTVLSKTQVTAENVAELASAYWLLFKSRLNQFTRILSVYCLTELVFLTFVREKPEREQPFRHTFYIYKEVVAELSKLSSKIERFIFSIALVRLFVKFLFILFSPQKDKNRKLKSLCQNPTSVNVSYCTIYLQHQ